MNEEKKVMVGSSAKKIIPQRSGPTDAQMKQVGRNLAKRNYQRAHGGKRG